MPPPSLCRGVSVCTDPCRLTLICLISTSKSLSSSHANKHIQPSFKPKATCLISGPTRRSIMHLNRCLASASQGSAHCYLLLFFSLSPPFMSLLSPLSVAGSKPPPTTGVTRARLLAHAYCTSFIAPDFFASEIDLEKMKPTHKPFKPESQNLRVRVTEGMKSAFHCLL